MPRWLIQETLQPIFWNPDRSAGPQILVINRKDASSRMLDNHGELMDTLRSSLPSHVQLIEFIGSENDVESTMRLFANADVVIGPHGAALTFTSLMRQGKAVIEMAYKGRAGMAWPSNYIHAMVVGSELRYYLSMADGSYGGNMHANVQVCMLGK